MKLNFSNLIWSRGLGWFITTFYTKRSWQVGVVTTTEANRSMYLPHNTKKKFLFELIHHEIVLNQRIGHFLNKVCQILFKYLYHFIKLINGKEIPYQKTDKWNLFLCNRWKVNPQKRKFYFFCKHNQLKLETINEDKSAENKSYKLL